MGGRGGSGGFSGAVGSAEHMAYVKSLSDQMTPIGREIASLDAKITYKKRELNEYADRKARQDYLDEVNARQSRKWEGGGWQTSENTYRQRAMTNSPLARELKALEDELKKKKRKYDSLEAKLSREFSKGFVRR